MEVNGTRGTKKLRPDELVRDSFSANRTRLAQATGLRTNGDCAWVPRTNGRIFWTTRCWCKNRSRAAHDLHVQLLYGSVAAPTWT